MKEATGEANMTVVTVVAIAAIAAIFYLWIWPSIQVTIAKRTCEAACGGECTQIDRAAINEANEDTDFSDCDQWQ